MVTTDAQVRKLMSELIKHGELGIAALRAGIGRKTAAKYAKAGKLPSELVEPRTWRTREDAFLDDWVYVTTMLLAAPELESTALFEHLRSLRPGAYEPGQVRTFQRRVQVWRACEGPPKEVFFTQEHRPGEAMQTDFTWGTKLLVTIAGEAFEHMLCHAVLPFSNWQWATVCHSESIVAIRRGIQSAVFQLGRHAEWSQTDNSTSATHRMGDDSLTERGFNEEYLALMKHLGMKPRTIGIGKSEQNGDVESLNGVLKRRLVQHLLIRGSRDFESEAAYETWVQSTLMQSNALRGERLVMELAAMTPVSVARLPEHSVVDVRVTTASTIHVKSRVYSVPSQLIEETVRVHIFDARLDVHYGGRLQLTIERTHGRGGHCINYRHVIESLVRKPGAFARYRYREAMYPSLVFRRAYDALQATLPGTRGDLAYLRVLHLAATTMESDVALALELLLDAKKPPTADAVKSLVVPSVTRIPTLLALTVDLTSYDTLLGTAWKEAA